MPIPAFPSLIHPLLVALEDGEERTVEEIRDTLAEQFRLTEEELEERLPSGRMKRYVNRVAWALAHLKGAACIESPRRGAYRITDRGQQLLADTPETENVGVSTLKAYEEYRRFRSPEDDEEVEAALGPKWGEAIRLCREILADRARLDEQEVTHKHEIAANVRAALEAAEDDQPVAPALEKALGKPNNLLDRYAVMRFKEWMQDEAAARRALLATQGRGSTAERVDAFNAEIPGEVLKTPGNRIAFASSFLMGSDPARYPLYLPTPIKGAEKLLEWPDAPEGSSPGREYEHHVAFVADFRDRLLEAGLEVRDMLDAQSLIWTLMRYKEPQYMAWRGEESKPSAHPGDGEPVTLEGLADQLYLDPPSFLEELVELLEDKRQLILYGPPGTGKTYIARRLAQFLAGDDSRRTEIVQFHPSYSYEDFVQGYRPRSDQRGNLTYELVDGPLLRLAERARTAPDERHVLLIDEVNRGKPAADLRRAPVPAGVPRRPDGADVRCRGLALQPAQQSVAAGYDEHRRPLDRADRRSAAPALPFQGAVPRSRSTRWPAGEMARREGARDGRRRHVRRPPQRPAARALRRPSAGRALLLHGRGPRREAPRAHLGGRHPAVPRGPALRKGGRAGAVPPRGDQATGRGRGARSHRRTHGCERSA